jgi:endo-1,4-beta-xylanase
MPKFPHRPTPAIARVIADMKLPKRHLVLAGGLVVLLIFALSGVLWWRHSHLTGPGTLPEPSLKALAAKHYIALGNFAIPTRIGEKPYDQILTSQFDFALLDNQPNWHFVGGDLRPSRTTYNFSQIDKVMNYAEAHHMPVQAHHFVWGEEKWLPDWLTKGNYNRQQLLDIIHDHIQTVGQRYSGRIQEWTVVNEAFTRGLHTYGLHDWWADHIGDQSYIDDSFRWARQADPHAKLLLNDFNNEGINDVSDAMYDYVKGALARGVPIDGIGMQMHIDGTHVPAKDEVIQNMQRFAALGLSVNVTEFDVNMNDLKISNQAKDTQEGEIYYQMMRACIESKVCHSFAFLGITDKETWYNYLGSTPNARPLMFDVKYHPKPAFYRVRDALQEP